MLRAYTTMATVDSLIDPRGMRLVAQRWVSSRDRGLVRLAESSAPARVPAPAPRCPGAQPG